MYFPCKRRKKKTPYLSMANAVMFFTTAITLNAEFTRLFKFVRMIKKKYVHVLRGVRRRPSWLEIRQGITGLF